MKEIYAAAFLLNLHGLLPHSFQLLCNPFFINFTGVHIKTNPIQAAMTQKLFETMIEYQSTPIKTYFNDRSLDIIFVSFEGGTLQWTRTTNLLIRSQMLYPLS